tara:strand:+ start:42 stop:695 length:654 start_codon:yes stop_codon:yes gene_type:complete
MRIKITIPEKLNDITLEQYQEFLKLQENEKDEYILGSKMIEIFCKVPYKNIFEYRVSHINSITKQLTKIFDQETKLLIRHFELDKIKYGFIPSLDDMSFGEYVDLDTYIKQWENMHKAMGVLYRPVTQKYNDRYLIEKYKAQDFEKMKQMPLDVVFSSIVFFYNLGNDLSKNILGYLNPQEMEILQQSQTLEKGGVGINQFMHSLREILQSTKISLN